jgi:hypothetical protein
VNEKFAYNATGIAIHHSVTGDVHPDAIAKMHIARWGSSAGVGYHFLISRDGTIWYVGDLGTWRAHVAGKNDEWIGVCLLGEHHKYAPTKAQYESAKILCDALQAKFGRKQIVRHSDLQATACPGQFTNMDYIRNGYPEVKPVEPIVTPPPIEVIPDVPTPGIDVPTEMIDPEPPVVNPIEEPEQPKEEPVEGVAKLIDMLKNIIKIIGELFAKLKG